MKSTSKIFIALLSLVLVFSLAACGGNQEGTTTKTDETSTTTDNKGEEAKEVTTFRIGHTLADNSHYQVGLENFTKLVDEKSEGRLKIEIFPNGSLGGERDMVESLQVGTLDMVLSSTGPLGGFVPQLNVVDLPFLFDNRDHAYAVLDGEIGQELLGNLNGSKLVGLAWWENGYRNISNSKQPIVNPEDLQGLKIRTMENEVHMASFRAMGADPTPMSFTELFTALQQGVVDGQENPIPIIYTSRFYEVQDHVSLTGHFYSPSVLLISESRFNALDEDLQQVLTEAAIEGAQYERQVVKDMDAEYVQELKDLGTNIVEDVNVDAFREAVKPVYETFEDQFGKDLIEKIQTTSY